ncbi:MAG: transporter [Pseudomonadota bacterium]
MNFFNRNSIKTYTSILFFAYNTITQATEEYTLFNPTPANAMRAMATERPSKTDSPYSVDAGHIQIETNLLGYSKNDDCNQGICTKTRQYEVGSFNNIRIGLTNRTDLQIVTDLYLNKTDEFSNSPRKERNQGTSDTQLRLKYNVFGNNPSDQYALGLLPYIKFATHRENLGNNKIEYGLGVPFNINFADDWSLGGMTVLSAINDEQHEGYDFAYANSLVVGKAINAKLRTYLEYYSYKARQPGERFKNTVDFGLIYTINPNFSADINVQKGVSDAADDLKFLVGSVYRF